MENMMKYIYNADIVFEEGEFEVYFPDVPEVVTGGRTYEEALLNAQDAPGLALRGRYADDEEFPEAKHQGGVPVSADAWNALKPAVIKAFRESGISPADE